jgi:protocatechuate 3,4-dioxygenase beta subunit
MTRKLHRVATTAWGHHNLDLLARRNFLGRAAFGAAALGSTTLWTPGAFAEALTPTPSIGEGPFYPDKFPLDTDNDLLIVNDAITPAVGTITHLSGRVLSPSGNPVRNAFVEIWQVDNTGSYLHKNGRDPSGNDANFQGYGRFLTDYKGQYYFRTIKPGPYSLFNIFRAPHIHLAISKNGRRIFTTQLLIKGHADNEKDGLFRMLRTPEERETILVDFKPLPNSSLGELTANFDVILGQTVQETEDGKLRGGIGKPISQNRNFDPSRQGNR